MYDWFDRWKDEAWRGWDGMVGREINGNDGKTLLLAIRLSVASLMALYSLGYELKNASLVPSFFACWAKRYEKM